MTDDIDRWMRTADPALNLPTATGGAARDVMRSLTRQRPRMSRLRLSALTTVALVAVGGGVAVAAPAVQNIFAPEPSIREVTVVSKGSATVRCVSTIETSIKLGDLDQHRATVDRWHAYAQHHDQTIRVPANSTRLQIGVAVGKASFNLIEDFNRNDSGQDLQDAADIFNTTHCTNLPGR